MKFQRVGGQHKTVYCSISLTLVISTFEASLKNDQKLDEIFKIEKWLPITETMFEDLCIYEEVMY